MALKAILAYAKKIPCPDQQFSSQSYHLSLETEISEGLGQNAIQQKIHDTFELVKRSVEQELQAGRGQKEIAAPLAPGKTTGDTREFTPGKATNRQLKLLSDLSRERNITLNQLNEQVKKLYGVDSIYGLSKSDCSKLVNSMLKEHKKAA